ncbi:histone acetylation protein-domain-containing protein [Trametes polyzona]|nr:histone acetylation protein-domain-containing protein [Trametes polyzona]
MESIDSTFGAALIGLIVGACLYGITILQTTAPYPVLRNYNNDTKFVKYLVTNFGNTDNLDRTTWCLQTDCNGLIGLIVEARNWLVTGVILVLAALHFGLGIGESILDVLFHAQWVTCLGLGAAAAADILIAVAMCYYLYKKRTGLKRVIGTVCVISFGAMPTNFVWLGFFWIMGKCELNSRERLRDKVTKAAVQLNNVGNGRSFQQSFTVSGAPKIKMSLRDKLLAALADLPGTRTFHVHVLTSSPRKHTGLFPYAHPRPRTYLQDVFVLLSEQAAPAAPRVLVTALEASVYHVPATASCVLYVSKVDSSGHAAAPSPTAALVRAFLAFYADPATRPVPGVRHLWLQLFARAQGQYLFPNSAEYPGKRPLSDVRLCAWWRRIFGEVAAEVSRRLKGGGGKVRLFYILPGYGELEATHTLGSALPRPTQAGGEEGTAVEWTYGHPYSQTEIPLPCPRGPDEQPHLGHFIPWFDDDPKSRFIDEIAHTTNSEGVRSPQRKRPRASTGSKPRSQARDRDEDEEKEAEAEQEKEQEKSRGREKGKDDKHHPSGELAQTSPDEFWERMSFRQECVAGAVTGFFAMGISTPAPVDASSGDKTAASQPSPLAPQPGQLAPRLVRRIVASLMNHHEFSTRERAVRATETLEAAIKGLCEDDAPVIPAPAPAGSSTTDTQQQNSGHELERPRTPEPSPSTLEIPRTPPPGRSHLSAGGGGGGVPEISPNPFPEPVASLETYTSYIYGSIEVRNPPLPPRGAAQGSSTNGSEDVKGGAAGGAAPVTVLQVRKKRKPAVP